MYIKKLTWRSRNDFGFICACEHCGNEFERGDGYANEHFQFEVLPNQNCPECGLNWWSKAAPTPALEAAE